MRYRKLADDEIDTVDDDHVDECAQAGLVPTRRAPGAGGVSGGPAKHCAVAIHAAAALPRTARRVSAMFRTCVTT
jgi:hypothetical protein